MLTGLCIQYLSLFHHVSAGWDWVWAEVWFVAPLPAPSSAQRYLCLKIQKQRRSAVSKAVANMSCECV